MREQASSSSVLRGAGRRRLSRASRSLLEAAPRTAATTALGSLRPWARSTTRALSCSWQALPSVLTALASSCSETRSVGQARTRRRRPSQWTTMTRVAALLRAPGRRFTRLAPGSVTFVSRSTGQPWKTARPLTRMGEFVRGTADPRGAHRPLTLPPSPWMRMWLLAAINGGPIRSPFARSRQRQCQRPRPGLPGGVSTPTLVGNRTFPSGIIAGNAARRRAKLSKWSSEFLTQLRTSAASPRALRATERSIPLTGLRKSSASPSSSGAGTRSAEAEGGTDCIPSRRQLPSAAAGALRFDAATPASSGSSASCC